jgi:hypothetical protein
MINYAKIRVRGYRSILKRYVSGREPLTPLPVKNGERERRELRR